MKKYIKPNTEIYAVELQKMIAESLQTSNTEITNQSQFLGKEDNTLPTSESIWGEEE
jgi:hypothetical protein